MITIHGKCGISATVLADSISPDGVRFTTYEWTYPRLILAELNTHRALSRNSASSRAIPFEKMVKTLDGRPVRFGEANPGMQDKGVDHTGLVDMWDADWAYDGEYRKVPPDVAWCAARDAASQRSQEFYEAGYHKQVYNRLTESFQMMKTVISATEWENFFWLRDHGAADPTLAELARVAREARDASQPVLLQPGEWHLPYVYAMRSENGGLYYYLDTPLLDDDINPYDFCNEINLEQAKAVSAARCAAVSFRNVDYGLIKCQEVYQRLVGDDRKHASAFEHQATPMEGGGQECAYHPSQPAFWQQGVSHMTRDGWLWSGNLKGWIQLRKLIPGECKEG